ncbi:MAG: hypothetical protein CL778_04275 [Chloroflexi bacterium]|nr:hypothetical protein [Chloroflexota bacterium]|tara:strand:- start:44838 stop:45581 length:744 start_codon:yes stop_codon:yes gene_type:complete
MGKIIPVGLIIDLDGTLLPYSDIPNTKVVNSLRSLAKKNIPIIICSGRMREGVSYYAKLLNLSFPQISDNGAKIFDPINDVVIYEAYIDSNETKKILNQIDFLNKSFFIGQSGKLLHTLENVDFTSITSITIRLSSVLEVEELKDKFSNRLISADVSIGSKNEWYINLTKKGVDKGSGVFNLCKILGFDPKNFVAVGDGLNDISMFKTVGISVAMGQSTKEVKENADLVVGTVDDNGLLDVIKEFFI